MSRARALSRVLKGLKSRARREVDLIRRPGRAHGYETPANKPPRTRSHGHEVYKKSLGVPGFKTRLHHDYIQSRKSLHRAGAVTAAVITGHGIHKTTQSLSKASALEKKARNQRLRSLKPKRRKRRS